MGCNHYQGVDCVICNDTQSEITRLREENEQCLAAFNAEVWQWYSGEGKATFPEMIAAATADLLEDRKKALLCDRYRKALELEQRYAELVLEEPSAIASAMDLASGIIRRIEEVLQWR